MKKVGATCNDGGRWQTIPIMLGCLIKHIKTCKWIK
jgi:hypothetical protein